MIPKSNHYAVTDNGQVMFTGNKNDCNHIRKVLRKQEPTHEIKVWLSSRHIGDRISR